MHGRNRFLILAPLLGALLAWWMRRRRSDPWAAADDPWPSLEAPIATEQPVMVPDPVADPTDLADAATEPHLTLLGDLPLDGEPEATSDESGGATVIGIGDRSGNGHR
jgi:hypothetical protein